MPPSRNILEALFDIRPITKSGVLDFEKINQVKGKIDLRKIEKPIEIKVKKIESDKVVFLNEFERAISEPVDIEVELMKFGGELAVFKPTVKKVEEKHEIESFWKREPKIPQIQTVNIIDCYYRSPVERELEIWLDLSKKNKSAATAAVALVSKKKKIARPVRTRLLSVFVGMGIIGLLTFGYGGVSLKNKIIESGNKAVFSLEEAKKNLANFNFLSAADNFALAYDDFGKASDDLNSFGASFLSNFGDIPGLDKVKSANNLVKAGQNISKAGENLALAFNTLSQANFLAQKSSLSNLINEFKEVLVYAGGNIDTARKLIAEVDSNVLPEDKQQLFFDFKEKIPEFKKYVGEAIDYSDFLLGVIGNKTTKKYLVLLQNNSELRATGGFPGSYALVLFENGFLRDVKVDDVYNIDGQLKENYIPPIPLQHITPNWGMRDANWFADFPTSAKKVEEFYKKDGGSDVDGVLTLTPKVIGEILDVIGGLDMPEYGIKINSSNFLAEIQEEVEYGANRAQPKTIVKELQPKLFAKLAEQDNSKWVEIFKILTRAVEEKHILAYFNDPKLENVAIENGMGGEVKSASGRMTDTSGDYLRVIFSNVKGSKTDTVTKNSFNLETQIGADSIDQKLTITRTHNGGDSEFGFYNKTNPAYIRIYVPLDSTLKSISGNTITDYKTLIGHEDYNFKTDFDLSNIESGITHPFKGVDVFKESGKTVFGFWLVINPKQTKSVTIDYESTAVLDMGSYGLLWQKQPGTNSDPIKIKITATDGKKIATSDNLNKSENEIVIESDLTLDREVQLKLK